MVDRLAEGTDPIFAIESVFDDGFVSRLHCHDRGQISYVQSGSMTILAQDYALVVPAGHAVWIPSHHMHQAVATGEISVLAVYLRESSLPPMPDTCSILQVSDLFEPLFKRIIARQILGLQDMVNDALLVVLHEEVRVARRLDVTAPMPQDPRLYRVCEAVLREPTINYSKEQLARIGHMSCRTMTRLFRSELQMTYSEWLQLALGIFAMMQLRNGQPVFQVAADLGYASPSAFTATFRRRFGFCPSEIRSTKRTRVNAMRRY